jgi:transcriptional regulator with GAF, ATPase, and Fis domain
VSDRSSVVAAAFRAAVLALAIAVLALETTAGIRVWQRVGQTFPGFAVYGTMTVDQLNQPYWTGVRAGLRPGDRILAVEGIAVRSLDELTAHVREAPAGTRLRYTVSRGGQIFELPIRSMIYAKADFLNSFAVLAFTALVFVLGGAAIAWFRPDAFGLGVYGFSLVVALNLGGGVELEWAEPLASEGVVTIPLATAALLHLAMVFPQPISLVRRSGAWALAPYAAMVPVAWLRLLPRVWSEPRYAALDALYRWLPFAAAMALLLAIRRAARGASREIVRRRARVVLWGLGLAVACYAVGFVATEIGWMPPAPNSTFVLPAWIWIVTLAVASARHDLFDLGFEARAELARLSEFAVTALLYMVVFAGAVLFYRPIDSNDAWLPTVVLLFVGVLLYEPLRWLARASVGLRRGETSRSRDLRELSAELGSSLDLREVASVVQRIPQRLGLSAVRLFLADGGSWKTAPGGEAVDAAISPLDAALESRALVSLDSLRDLDSEELADDCRRSLEALGLAGVIALRWRDRLIGTLGWGKPRRGALLSAADLRMLGALANNVAVAIENARAFERIRDLEQRVFAENVVLKEELLTQPGLGGLVGNSATMRRLLDWIAQVAPTDATVLVRGETGTGKELVARALHATSSRRDRPMIRVNCAAVPAGLLEAEFFGHERGAFTGATARKLGRFELAAGGTIFLDEIGDLPTELQPKLLRVLQDHQFERVGGTTVRVDVRVIAATNRDLEALVREGRFREDLFFRLNVLPVVVPPLRERSEDIPALVAHFLQRYAAQQHKPLRGVEERTLRALQGYRWPGNVRELENVIERAVVLTGGESLVVRDLAAAQGGKTPFRPLGEQLRDAKVRSIRRALSRTGGNQARAAQLLGLQPSSLSRMMKQLGIRERAWRAESSSVGGGRASASGSANPS